MNPCKDTFLFLPSFLFFACLLLPFLTAGVAERGKIGAAYHLAQQKMASIFVDLFNVSQWITTTTVVCVQLALFPIADLFRGYSKTTN